eukprot:tig00020921_g15919.t1
MAFSTSGLGLAVSPARAPSTAVSKCSFVGQRLQKTSTKPESAASFHVAASSESAPSGRRQFVGALAGVAALIATGDRVLAAGAEGGLEPDRSALLIKVPESSFKTTESGLKYADVKVGTGPGAEKGETIVIAYRGSLPDGRTVLSTYADGVGDGKPAQYRFGVGEVIPGLDEGVATMRVGGQRRLIVPPSLAFGSKVVKAAPGKPSIPANTTLTFDVELLLIPGKDEDE